VGQSILVKLWTRESQAACLAHEKHVQIVGINKIFFTILIYFYHYIVGLRCVPARTSAKDGAWDPRVQICIENCIPEMPLCRQLVQIIGRNKFSIRFESLCWILRVSSRTRMGQNQAKSNNKGCSFGSTRLCLNFGEIPSPSVIWGSWSCKPCEYTAISINVVRQKLKDKTDR